MNEIGKKRRDHILAENFGLNRNVKKLLAETIERLNKFGTQYHRHYEAFDLYFGLSSEPLTLDEVGQRMGVSGSQAAQLRDRAMLHLKHPSLGLRRKFTGK